MKYRKFSDLNWNVSEVGLGCWQIDGVGVMFQTKMQNYY